MTTPPDMPADPFAPAPAPASEPEPTAPAGPTGQQASATALTAGEGSARSLGPIYTTGARPTINFSYRNTFAVIPGQGSARTWRLYRYSADQPGNVPPAGSLIQTGRTTAVGMVETASMTDSPPAGTRWIYQLGTIVIGNIADPGESYTNQINVYPGGKVTGISLSRTPATGNLDFNDDVMVSATVTPTGAPDINYRIQSSRDTTPRVWQVAATNGQAHHQLAQHATAVYRGQVWQGTDGIRGTPDFTSAEISVTWERPSVRLVASPSNPRHNQNVQLTAITTNTPNNVRYRFQVFNSTTRGWDNLDTGDGWRTQSGGTITTPLPGQNRAYRVQVGGHPIGSTIISAYVTSASANVSWGNTPTVSITASPGTSLLTGASVALTAVPSISGTYRYRWRRGTGTPTSRLLSATAPTTLGLSRSTAGSYTYTVELFEGTSTTAVANASVTITWSAVSLTLAQNRTSPVAGQTVIVTGTASRARLYWSWRIGGTGAFSRRVLITGTTSTRTRTRSTAGSLLFEAEVYAAQTGGSALATASRTVTWAAATPTTVALTAVSVSRTPAGTIPNGQAVNLSGSLTPTNATGVTDIKWQRRTGTSPDVWTDLTTTGSGGGPYTASYTRATAGNEVFRFTATQGSTQRTGTLTVHWGTPTGPYVTIHRSDPTSGDLSLSADQDLEATPNNVPAGTSVWYQFQRSTNNSTWSNWGSRQSGRTKTDSWSTAQTRYYRVQMYNASSGGAALGSPSGSVVVRWVATIGASITYSPQPTPPAVALADGTAVSLHASLLNATANSGTRYTFQSSNFRAGPYHSIDSDDDNQVSANYSIAGMTDEDEWYRVVITHESTPYTSDPVHIQWGEAAAPPPGGTTNRVAIWVDDDRRNRPFTTRNTFRRSPGQTNRDLAYGDTNDFVDALGRERRWYLLVNFEWNASILPEPEEDDDDGSPVNYPLPGEVLCTASDGSTPMRLNIFGNPAAWSPRSFGSYEQSDGRFYMQLPIFPSLPDNGAHVTWTFTANLYTPANREGRRGALLATSTCTLTFAGKLAFWEAEPDYALTAGDVVTLDISGAGGGVSPYTYELEQQIPLSGATWTRTTGGGAGGRMGRYSGTLERDIIGGYAMFKKVTDLRGNTARDNFVINVTGPGRTKSPTVSLGSVVSERVDTPYQSGGIIIPGTRWTLTATVENPTTITRYEWQHRDLPSDPWERLPVQNIRTTNPFVWDNFDQRPNPKRYIRCIIWDGTVGAAASNPRAASNQAEWTPRADITPPDDDDDD